MASRHRSNSTSSYRTYGSVAYAPAYDGSAVRAPGRESTLQPRPKVRPRTRERAPHPYQGTGAGGGGGFALCGDRLCRGGRLCRPAVFSYAQFVMANDAVVTLRNDLKTLQAENVTLSARYEQVFDMERIQAAVGTPWSAPQRSRSSIWTCPNRTAWCCMGRRRPPPAYRARFRGSRILCMS